MADWDATIWHGVEIRHPGDWEVTVASAPDADQGQCVFADRYWQRLDVQWRRLTGRPTMNILLEKFRSDHIKRVRKVKADGDDPKADLTPLDAPIGDWDGFLIDTAGGNMLRVLRIDEEENMLLEASVFCPKGRRNTALEREVLAGITPLPSEDSLDRWRAMGLDVTLDKSFKMTLNRPMAGEIHWEFEDKAEGYSPLIVERMAMAEHVMGRSLPDWMPQQLPANSTVVSQFAETINGHLGQTIISHAPYGRLGGVKVNRNVRIETAWVCPMENRLYRLCRQRITDQETVELPDPLIVLCCRPSPAVVPLGGSKGFERSGIKLGSGRTTEEFLSAVPHRNQDMDVERLPTGELVIKVEMDRPWYMFPPISWVLPYGRHRRLQLDTIGAGLTDLCDGRRTIENVIEIFAANHKLTFREAQVPVTLYLRQLTQRGVMAIAGGPSSD